MTAAQQNAIASTIILLENVKLTAYRDATGTWTIGAGHTKNVVAGQTITFAQAIALMQEDLAPIYEVLAGKPDAKSTELIAWTSFGFNVGVNALKRVLVGEDTISNPIHTTSHGVVLLDLVKRRNFEMAYLEL